MAVTATYLKRGKSKFDSKAFCQDLELKLMILNTQLKSVSPLNFNQLFAEFLQTVEGIIELHAPLKKVIRKQRKLQAKPGITKEILVSIRYKQKICKSHFLQENEAEKCLYKKYCYKLTKIKVLAKKNFYYKDQFFRHNADPRKT